jgi:PhnB protein
MSQSITPNGYLAVAPYLSVRNSATAIEFYKQTFNATERHKMVTPDGRICHVELLIGDAVIMLADEWPDCNEVQSPESLNGTSIGIQLYVEDVDKVVQQAIQLNAKLLAPISNQFYGDRMARVQDPFGHIWYINTHIEDVSPEDMTRRFQAIMN